VLVAEAPLNKEISLKVLREGKVIELKTKILEAPIKTEKKHSPKERLEGGSTIKRSGITFSELNSELRQKLNLADEVNAIVITSLDKDKKTYGLRIGDLVIAVNQQYVTTIDQLDKIYQKAKSDGKKNVILLVQRRSVNIFIALPIVE
jgi:serine protease Do